VNWIRPASEQDPRLKTVGDDLRVGALAILPTDTVYGISANALSLDAIERVFQLKERAVGKPFIVIVSDFEMATTVCEAWPEEARELASKHWPGPLSIIVPAAKELPPAVTAGTGRVALRVPGNPITRKIIALAGVPLISTSANISGEAPAHTAKEAVESLGVEAIQWVVDIGTCDGPPSTIVDATNDMAVVRHGAIVL
jgi:L-threonylcarbamoyladenylate synthase